jgi:hypothetical protein
VGARVFHAFDKAGRMTKVSAGETAARATAHRVIALATTIRFIWHSFESRDLEARCEGRPSSTIVGQGCDGRVYPIATPLAPVLNSTDTYQLLLHSGCVEV